MSRAPFNLLVDVWNGSDPLTPGAGTLRAAAVPARVVAQTQIVQLDAFLTHYGDAWITTEEPLFGSRVNTVDVSTKVVTQRLLTCDQIAFVLGGPPTHAVNRVEFIDDGVEPPYYRALLCALPLPF